MPRRLWRRIMVGAGIVGVSVAIDLATNVLASGVSIWVGLSIAVVVEVLMAVLDHRAASWTSPDPRPPDPPPLPPWLVNRPAEAEQIIAAVLDPQGRAV